MIALQKVTDILELFLESENELSLSEMSQQTGLNKSTINRIASYLVERGYLSQKEKRGKYFLGMKFLDFSLIIKKRIKIREIALQHLTDLKHDIGESCGLVIWDRMEATLVDMIYSDSILTVLPKEVTRLPLHSTACGKIFLANMSAEEKEKYLSNSAIKRFTSQTITDPAKLKRELKSVLKNGVAFDIDENVPGVASVGAKIKDFEGNVVAAAVVVGPTSRLTRNKLKAIAPKLKKCALDISRAIGWQGY